MIRARTLALAALAACTLCACVTELGGGRRGRPPSPVALGAAGLCVLTCERDEQCGDGERCLASRCVSPEAATRCVAAIDCGLLARFCAADADCAEGEACIDAGTGPGRCAFVPDETTPCDASGRAARALPSMEASASIVVCVDEGASCHAGACAVGCDGDAMCPAAAPHCNAASGTCVCASDAECVAPGAPACIEGSCQCRTDADCAGLAGAEACIDGVCGCRGDDACTAAGMSLCAALDET